MINQFYRTRDRIEEWLRYPQPTVAQKQLLGMHTDVIDTEFTAVRLASEDEDAQRFVIGIFLLRAQRRGKNKRNE